MGDVGNSIISGAAGGAIAGLVVTLILAAYSFGEAKLRRNEQIRHLQEMIANDRAHIYDIPEQTDAPLDPNRPSPDAFRYILFDGMRRELELALDGRSSEITFDEIRQIRKAFILHDLLRDKAPGKHPEGLAFYNDIFKELEEIGWLELPSREDE